MTLPVEKDLFPTTSIEPVPQINPGISGLLWGSRYIAEKTPIENYVPGKEK